MAAVIETNMHPSYRPLVSKDYKDNKTKHAVQSKAASEGQLHYIAKQLLMLTNDNCNN